MKRLPIRHKRQVEFRLNTYSCKLSRSLFNRAHSLGFNSTSTSPKIHHRPSSTSSKKRRRPLEGTTVVSLEQAIAAPLCTRHLADLGARVIKVERPDGDFARAYDDRVMGLSSHFVWTNRSKESLALDLKNADDLGVLKTLLKKTDVFVSNLAPGATSRLGLSYEKLKADFPALIVCDISGYGLDGPYSNKKAYDLIVQSEAGVLSVTGMKNEPAKVGLPVADIAAGMYAYSNILAALLQRGKEGDGMGCHIDVSMLESTVEWMGFPMYYAYEGASPPGRMGASHPTVFPYGPFKTGDGGSVMLGIQNEREWIKFCDVVMRNSSLASDPRFEKNSLRSDNRVELTELIHAAFENLTATQVLERLDEAGIANAKVNTMRDVWEHPQLKARQRWTQVGTSAGNIPALTPPGFVGGDSQHEQLDIHMTEVPSIGQHNSKILKELGLAKK